MMKSILYLSFVFCFTSCSKKHVSWNLLNSSSGGSPNTGDPSNKVKANITRDGATYMLSSVGSSTYFSRVIIPQYNDSTFIGIYTIDSNGIDLRIDLTNITDPGTFNFGLSSISRKQVKVECLMHGISYFNDHTSLSGTMKIDTLTTKHIQGSFSVTCWHELDSVNITNGSFSGNF